MVWHVPKHPLAFLPGIGNSFYFDRFDFWNASIGGFHRDRQGRKIFATPSGHLLWSTSHGFAPRRNVGHSRQVTKLFRRQKKKKNKNSRGYFSRRIYPVWLVEIFYTIQLPLVMAGQLLIALYWHDILIQTSLDVSAFLTKLKWLFFTALVLLNVTEVVTAGIRASIFYTTGTCHERARAPFWPAPLILCSRISSVLFVRHYHGNVDHYGAGLVDLLLHRVIQNFHASQKHGRQPQLQGHSQAWVPHHYHRHAVGVLDHHFDHSSDV